MSEQTPPITLPARSYEEAYPWLRRPYMPTQVWAKVQTTPKTPNSPCTIALFSIGETLMDRLNLLCGREWDHHFEKTGEAKSGSGRELRWYCEVSATITVFGKTESDIGQGIAPTRVGAEMNARAQAYKRTGRKFGPGQCLYACDEILMFRGDGENQLRLPKGEDAHLHPYFDEQGHGRRYVRGRYEEWLRETGEAIYGEPLNHLELAVLLQAQAASLAVAIPAAIPAAGSNGGAGSIEPAAQQRLVTASNGTPATPTNGSTVNGHDGAPAPAQQTNEAGSPAAYEPMPDYPAPPAAIEAASNAGYSEQVARALCNLARTEGQGDRFLRSQLNVVENWLTALHGLDVPEDVLIGAAAFNAKRRTSQERRQALFSQWLARRAAGATPAETGEGEQPDTAQQPPQPQAPGEQPQSASQPQLDRASAIAELQGRMAEHEYGDRPVTRLAALAVGAGPQAQITWGKMKPETLLVLSDLLDCAAALGWDAERLDREVLDAHASSRQQSAAGRFSAFANTLKDMAETRQMEGE